MKTVKKLIKIAVIAVAVCAGLFALWILSLIGGSDYREYPYERASVWICVELDMTIDLSGTSGTGHLKWNGKEHSVTVGTRAGQFSVLYPWEEEKPLLDEERLLFKGDWHYEGENLVVTITEDKIFGGAYKTIVFTPKK